MEAQNRIEVQKHFQTVYHRADRFVEISLLLYFFFGVGIAFYYDTWQIALGAGLPAVGMYWVAKWFFPTKTLNQHIAGLSFAVFMAQFIYQMHGLFEMHFFAFIGTIILITYQNWKAFIPITLLIVSHHAAFAYLQFIGYEEIYFTQLDYMSLSTFLFHVGLAAVIIGLCGYWAFDFRKHTVNALLINLKMQGQLAHTDQNISFAAEIAKGNLTVEKDREQSDALGRSLIDMQEKLREARKREQREKFLNVGLAEISDILRKNVHSLEELSDNVVSYLVKYLKANQGAIFIADDVETGAHQTLTMTACYAYQKKRFVEKIVQAGQGLIGQTYLEKKTVHLTQVPQNYVTITSGLGESTPSSLVLVPLIVNESIEGVIELASFQAFSPDDIMFLEKVGESIASMVTSSKSSLRMTRLLEASRTGTEELRATEEEMRQNNEELQAIQEEMERKEKEQAALFQAVQQSVGVIELDKVGYIEQINDRLARELEYQADELRGQPHTKLINDIGSSAYQTFWECIKREKIGQHVLDMRSKQGEVHRVSIAVNPLSAEHKTILLCWLETTAAIVVK